LANTSCSAGARRGRGRPLEEVVGLADELDVAVFDAVVDHLDVVARAPRRRPSRNRAVPSATLAAIDWKIDLTAGQASGVAAGHDRRPFEGPFLAAGHARADEQQPLLP